MDYKIALAITLLLIFVTSALRKRTMLELQVSTLLVSGNARLGEYLYSLIMLPGTILHELSHWLVAELLRVPTGQFRILPDLQDGQEKRLGFVMVGHTGPIKGFLIGIAPLIIGILTLVGLGHLLQDLWGVALWWQIALALYGMITVGNSIVISPSDRRYFPAIAILAILIYGFMYYAGVKITFTYNEQISAVLQRVNLVLGLTIALNLGMILVLYLLRRVVEILSKKKVVTRRNK